MSRDEKSAPGEDLARTRQPVARESVVKCLAVDAKRSRSSRNGDVFRRVNNAEADEQNLPVDLIALGFRE
jgi:hypothetical protein